MERFLFILIVVLLLLWASPNGREGLQRTPLFDGVYYINLDKRPRKRARIEEQLRTLEGLIRDPIRVGGVDGSRLATIDPQVVSEQGAADLKTPVKKYGLTLTRGAVGCAMSHKVIWEEVAAGRKELALVLEDDAVILPSFRDRIPLIVAELPETWDILYLGSGQYEVETAISPHLARPSNIFGLFGYAINWRGAERLLKRVFPLRYQIDTELWRNFSTLDPLLAVPFIVGENKERSDVGPAFFTKISFCLSLTKVSRSSSR